MKAVDWEKVGSLCGQVDLVALQQAATRLCAAGHHAEFAAACDAVSSLTTLAMIARRGGDPPWGPLPRAVRDEMKRDRGDS